MISSWSQRLSGWSWDQYPGYCLLTGGLTEVDDMDALGAKFFRSNLSLRDTAIVGIVDDDLPALYGEKVHDLVFELCLDATPECVGRL